MSLLERLTADMKEAMKAKEAGKVRLSTIRMAKSAIKNAEIEKKRELTEEEIIEVIAREVKQRRDAMEEYRKAGREDIVQQLEAEVAVLLPYLPEQLDENQLRQLIQEAIAATGAQGPKEMGKVMGYLMPKIKGRADGKLVNHLVKEYLG
ncbi:hypothetical protein SAMN02745885_00876 [Carboxydocella sporoproducens DSM 16521]|uniref:GatB/YqeY domain-containing protein n=2 Tax=Carboxydocella TaxID=178898 RepID=A0A1T4NGB3_9FIRM|nr:MULTISPECIES: GatB/YqeY domain-containing protein [Carboxydocella]AVX20013.1 hypothetical protein CFE_0815 [Carboxydocella thermautotrophica]AVX30429.1 hypothetical protein CTH_0829 [Carboxydocella thermautotrophica]SJZ77798.1 hypothetical protein SAMN02745885_00876 [Carboxydocella sporoproducens DSM 16521]